MCGDDFKGSALKILFVAPYLPSPPLSGGQRRLEGLIRGLSARHEVSLLCFAESDPGETREYCQQLVTVDFDSRGVAVSRRRLLQLRSLVSIRSFEHRLFRQPDVQVRLDQLLSSNSYDVIQVEFCQMAGHEFPSGNSQRPLLVLDEHNIEYDVIRRTSEGSTAFGRRIYHEINWRKLKREELSVWKRFDGVVVERAGDAVPPITADDARRQSSSMVAKRWAVSRPPSPKRASTDLVRLACQTFIPLSSVSCGVLSPCTSRGTTNARSTADNSTVRHVRTTSRNNCTHSACSCAGATSK